MQKTKLFLSASLCVLGACTFVRLPNDVDLARIENPPADIARKVEEQLQIVLPWYVSSGLAHEHIGRPLSATELLEAKTLGIIFPQKVRIVEAKTFPFPTDPTLAALVKSYGIGSGAELGRTHGYVIFTKPKYGQTKWLIRHELVHVSQIEKLGEEVFLRRYLTELQIVGYSKSPLEFDAATRWQRRTETSTK